MANETKTIVLNRIEEHKVETVSSEILQLNVCHVAALKQNSQASLPLWQLGTSISTSDGNGKGKPAGYSVVVDIFDPLLNTSSLIHARLGN